MRSFTSITFLAFICFILAFPLAGNAENIQKASKPAADTLQVHAAEDLTISQQINSLFIPFVDALSEVLFFDPFSAVGIYDEVVRDENGNPVIDQKGGVVTAPLKFIVVWLILGGLFFTIFMRFVNVRAIGHSIQLIRGKYDKPGSGGEVSHFQALTTALSATVGLGNIAGVAIAIAIGGPGATIWMILAGLLGMSSKFTECTLGVKYRRINKKENPPGRNNYTCCSTLLRVALNNNYTWHSSYSGKRIDFVFWRKRGKADRFFYYDKMAADDSEIRNTASA